MHYDAVTFNEHFLLLAEHLQFEESKGKATQFVHTWCCPKGDLNKYQR